VIAKDRIGGYETLVKLKPNFGGFIFMMTINPQEVC
jgi:hypothetical protein